jgi:hypothetical protein
MQRDVEMTIRTAPVDELTQAEIIDETGAAIAAVPTKSENTAIANDLREDIGGPPGRVLGETPI